MQQQQQSNSNATTAATADCLGCMRLLSRNDRLVIGSESPAVRKLCRGPPAATSEAICDRISNHISMYT